MEDKYVIIYGQVLKDTDVEYVIELCTALEGYGYRMCTTNEYAQYLKLYDILDQFQVRIVKNPSEVELTTLFSLGGDGTILRASQWLREANIPILGINMGRLGFLASIENTKIKNAIKLWHLGEYTIEHRGMLRLETQRSLFPDFPYGLNDFTIHKKDTSSMITIHTTVNGEHLNSYWADGLIVSTPTGSTGYSLSCGGPIIYPGSGNIVITPVAPHNLNVRPMVLPDSVDLRLKVDGRADSFLCTLDSRYETITHADELILKKGDFTTSMISLKGESFMNTIRHKLAWGLDRRNTLS